MDNPESYLHNRLPEVESLKRFASELNQLDLNTISVEELKQKINTYFPIINFSAVYWDSRYHIFRVRRNFNNGFNAYNNICNIGLPPVDKTPFGRANNEYDPIFYGSYEGDLSLFESCQNLTEEDRFEPQNFTMGIWKVKDNQVLRLVPITDNYEVKQARPDIRKVSESTEKLYTEKLTSQKVIEGSKIISKFFADQFAKSEIKNLNDYKISAFLANTIRDFNKISEIKFDGILYPSVAHKYRADNVAIFPQSLHKIEIVKCCSIIAYNFNFEQGNLVKGITAEGKVSANGEIIWTSKL